jgi:hypothetical protein
MISMKLPNVSRGPVLLLDIDYAKNLSEETFAFTAQISVEGVGSALVSNNGRGGMSIVRDQRVYAAVQAYAASLPHEDIGHGMVIPVDADFLISLLVGDAIDLYERKLAERRAERARTRPLAP